jgi:long-subunit acyl-CoA synthetase (AMP-forming)
MVILFHHLSLSDPLSCGYLAKIPFEKYRPPPSIWVRRFANSFRALFLPSRTSVKKYADRNCFGTRPQVRIHEEKKVRHSFMSKKGWFFFFLPLAPFCYVHTSPFSWRRRLNLGRYPQDIAYLLDDKHFLMGICGLNYLGVKVIDGVEKVMTYPELGGFEWISYRQAGERVNNVASGFARMGIQRGEPVAIFEDTRLEWTLASRACYCHAYVVFTVYANLGEDALVFALNQGEIRNMVTNASLLRMLAKIVPLVKSLRKVVYIGKADPKDLEALKSKGVEALNFDDVEADGKANPVAHEPPALDELACVMYTSGSTGNPKGVMINHRNLVAALGGMEKVLPIVESDVYLSFLPLAHIFAFICENVFLAAGATLGFGSPRTVAATGVRNCLGDIAELRPTILLGVPTIYERLKQGILAKVAKASPVAQLLFRTAYKAKLNALRVGSDTPLWNKIVFKKFQEGVGGRLRLIVSGSAPLSPDVHDFLRVAFGIPVMQGYGLTETSSSGCVQYPQDMSTARLGPPFPSMEVKLVDVPDMNYTSSDKPCPRGEIWLRGGPVSIGYYKEPEKTKESFHDGWFATGDIGISYPDGTFAIIDRKKNLIKPPHGEYIALEKLESVLRNSKFVETILVYVDSEHHHCIAALVPNREPILELAQKTASVKASKDDFAALCHDPEIQRLVLLDLQNVGRNLKLKSIETVRAIRLLPEQWTPQNFYLTAAMKLNRGYIVNQIRPMIDEMYANLHGAE